MFVIVEFVIHQLIEAFEIRKLVIVRMLRLQNSHRKLRIIECRESAILPIVDYPLFVFFLLHLSDLAYV